jgi:hypothetical protein
MKKSIISIVFLSVLLLIGYSCRQNAVKESKVTPATISGETIGLFLLGKDIITEVVLKPDTAGDPWELEKIRSYNGSIMYKDLFDKISRNEITAYDILSGKPLSAKEVRDITKEFNNDLSKIGKIQFLEDWYYDPSSSRIIKKLKVTTFAYEYRRQNDLPVAFKPLFRIKM